MIDVDLDVVGLAVGADALAAIRARGSDPRDLRDGVLTVPFVSHVHPLYWRREARRGIPPRPGRAGAMEALIMRNAPAH